MPVTKRTSHVTVKGFIQQDRLEIAHLPYKEIIIHHYTPIIRIAYEKGGQFEDMITCHSKQ